MSTCTPSPDSNASELVEEEEETTSIKNAVVDVFDDLIDEVVLGVCFEVHKMNKLGTLFLSESDPESMKQFEIVDERGLDVFGQVPMKKQLECICPNCSRNLAASRFAPHLEKCMGMGRNSSRIASRRIANAGNKKDGSDNESENDDDYEWTSNRGSNKRRKDKNNASRNKRLAKLKNNGDIPSVGSSTSDPPLYETMSLVERKALLHQTCGVISEHTKRMCTRSFKCPQHSDEQRRAVRVYLLNLGSVLGDHVTGDEDHVDIDGYDDGDSQALRDTLQWEANSNPSPADSTSTTNSSGSKKQLVLSGRRTKPKSGLHGDAGRGRSTYDLT